MLEKYLVEHCAPTLASLKTASLFTFDYSCDAELEKSLNILNDCFESKGLTLLALKKENGKALIYVYRKNRLSKELKNPEVERFLKNCGYNKTDISSALNTLKLRLRHSDFPHEIGIFLGYPLGDVIGFIKNAGRECKCTGCWKVYCNECEAIKTFEQYKKCKDIYMRLFRQGRSVWQLTVAA